MAEDLPHTVFSFNHPALDLTPGKQPHPAHADPALDPDPHPYHIRIPAEVTRLAAVRALTVICGSHCAAADMSPVLEPVVSELTGFLRKANRMLRQASLQALEVGWVVGWVVGWSWDCGLGLGQQRI